MPKAKTRYDVPNGVKSIGSSAFRDCTDLTSVTIPTSITSIGGSAFYGCAALTVVSIPNGVTSIGDFAFDGCTNLTKINIPDSVESIGICAFENCTSLTSVTIPGSVTILEAGTFHNCSSLASVSILSGVASIRGSGVGGAFEGCSKLTSVYIPSSVTSILTRAFYNCSSLTSISIPSSVTSINGNVFTSCRNFKTVYGGKDSYAETFAKLYNFSFTAVPSILTQPQSKTIAAGKSVTLTVEAVSTDGGTLTYQWKKGGVDITGATNASYIINAATVADSGIYSVVVTSIKDGSTPRSVTSDLVAVSVISEPNQSAGDIDGDGKVATADADLLKNYLMGKITLPDDSLAKADLDHDGKITSTDYALQKKLAIEPNNVVVLIEDYI